MSKLTIGLVFALSWFAVPVLADLEGSYVIIQYYTVRDDGTELVFGTSDWDCGTGNYMYDTYFRSEENGVGIVGGTYADFDDVAFEMPLCFELQQRDGRIVLQGVIKAYDIEDNRITDGLRKVIYQDIEYNKQVDFRLRPLKNELPIGVRLTLVDRKPEPEVADGPISLRTKFLNVDGVFGYHTSSRCKIEPEVEFQTSTGKVRDDGNMEKALIISEVQLPGYPDRLEAPFQTELRFKRIYRIDTMFVSDREFTPNIVYESTYEKQVDLVPGKTLLLVFPADTPSVRGYDREDTLIIKP